MDYNKMIMRMRDIKEYEENPKENKRVKDKKESEKNNADK